jgi:8-oxo-dGTP diphosphatase
MELQFNQEICRYQRRESDVKLLIVATCALVDPDGRVLLVQRESGMHSAELWEFPGGKIESDETPEETIIREFREDFGVEIETAGLAPLSFASHAYGGFHLLMPFYVCRNWYGQVQPLDDQAVKWLYPGQLGNTPMPPADLPLIAPLIDLLSSSPTMGATAVN